MHVAPLHCFVINLGSIMATIEQALDGIHGPRETYRPLLEPVAILNRICRTAELRAQQQGVDPWSVISDITGHGSGVSNAIYKVYRQQQPEVANPPE